MSASSITPKNRDTIFDRLLKSFLKEGNDHLLFRNFALGKDWKKHEVHFQYLYLNLLCNFSCDVDYYFNEKLKELLTAKCTTKINLDEISCENDCYSIKLEKTDNLTIIECMLKNISSCINDNISKTITVHENDLIGYTGTLEEKIAAYITAQGYNKDAIDADVWIDYIENPE